MKHAHPPTTCARSLFLTKQNKPLTITKEEVEDMADWYWQNSEAIWDQLPLTIEGVMFTHWWQLDIEQKILPAWSSGRLREGLARAYVYSALRRLCRGLEQ